MPYISTMIGRGIKILRALKGISQERLAELTGYSVSTISRIENNKLIPPKEKALAVADALGVPPAVVAWYALEEDNIDQGKMEAFNLLKPTIDRIIENEYINPEKK